jgi:hypothetical protein
VGQQEMVFKFACRAYGNLQESAEVFVRIPAPPFAILAPMDAEDLLI